MKRQPRHKDSFDLGQGKVRELFLRNIPIEPELWEAVKLAARRDDRSASSWIRVAIRERFKALGVDVAPLEDCSPSRIEVLYNDEAAGQ